ncbi:hypothetical protein QBC47DRAFT_25320 [Echria macrotheca]|uniref:Uncharacterized protein n=1 Tax=Echria macrotheca TaxID=438768 RepID=A0AAJ0BN93_9PEZI|nr:hypothetical protein QBC47DRAFT_25320 [Echria macrotheca]
MTVLGQLTTTFEAPSTCTTTTPKIYQIWTGSTYRYEQGPLFTSGSDCFPGAYDPAPNNYYSPGFCPGGYTAACTKTASVQTGSSGVETALVCCPTGLGYACLADADQTAALGLGCTASLENALAIIGVTVISAGTTSGFKTVTETGAAFAAHSIQVRYRAGDIPLPSVTPAPSGTSISTSPISTSSSEIPIPPPPPPLQGGGGGVSTATAIGIGIGSALAALLLAAAIGSALYLRHIRRKRKNNLSSPPPPPPGVPPKDTTTLPRSSIYTMYTSTTATTPSNLAPSDYNHLQNQRFELSEDIPRYSYSHQPYDNYNNEYPTTTTTTTTTTTAAAAAKPTNARRSMVTYRTSRTERTGTETEPERSELEDANFIHSKAAELDVPLPSSSSSSSSAVYLRVDERDRDRERERATTPVSVSVSESESSASWTIMRREEGVVATPWL